MAFFTEPWFYGVVFFVVIVGFALIRRMAPKAVIKAKTFHIFQDHRANIIGSKTDLEGQFLAYKVKPPIEKGIIGEPVTVTKGEIKKGDLVYFSGEGVSDTLDMVGIVKNQGEMFGTQYSLVPKQIATTGRLTEQLGALGKGLSSMDKVWFAIYFIPAGMLAMIILQAFVPALRFFGA